MRPSGPNRTRVHLALQDWSWPLPAGIVPTAVGRVGSDVSQSSTTASRSAVASRRLPGWTATECTSLWWPISTAVGSDHSRTRPSALPVARARPSGLNSAA